VVAASIKAKEKNTQRGKTAIAPETMADVGKALSTGTPTGSRCNKTVGALC